MLDKRLTVRMPSRVHRRLRVLAAYRDTSMQNLLIRLIEELPMPSRGEMAPPRINDEDR